MKIPHLYSDAEGNSHFGEIEIPMSGNPSSRIQSLIQAATGWRIAVNQPGHSVDFHPTGVPTFLAVLSGEHVMTASDGTEIVSRAGDVLFAQDLSGKGHAARFTGTEPSVTLTIMMPPPGGFKG